jgi:hypothetical protein
MSSGLGHAGNWLSRTAPEAGQAAPGNQCSSRAVRDEVRSPPPPDEDDRHRLRVVRKGAAAVAPDDADDVTR